MDIDSIPAAILIVDGGLVALSAFYAQFLGWAWLALMLSIPVVLAHPLG